MTHNFKITDNDVGRVALSPRVQVNDDGRQRWVEEIKWKIGERRGKRFFARSCSPASPSHWAVLDRDGWAFASSLGSGLRLTEWSDE